MVRPNPMKIKKLKKQDKELSSLPTIEEEKKKFGKGESFLSRLLRRKSVKVDKQDLPESVIKKGLAKKKSVKKKKAAKKKTVKKKAKKK